MRSVVDTGLKARGNDGVRRICQIVDDERRCARGPRRRRGAERGRQTPALEGGVPVLGDYSSQL